MSDLFLTDRGIAPKAQIHPAVLFSMADHHQRRKNLKGYVLGALMGGVAPDGSIEVHSSCAVPFKESEEQIDIDGQFLSKALRLHLIVNASERVVGWYTTSPDLTPQLKAVHKIFARNIGQQQTALLIQMDARTGNDEVPIKAFISEPLGVGETATTVFTPIATAMNQFGAERIGVRMLQRAKHVPNSTQTVMTDIEHTESVLARLVDLIDSTQKHVKEVLASNAPSDPQVGRAIMNALAQVPQMDSSEFEQQFQASLQDLLMVMYLSELTETQLVLSEKINALL